MSDIAERLRGVADDGVPAWELDAAELRALADLVEAARRYRDATKAHHKVLTAETWDGAAVSDAHAARDFAEEAQFDALARLDGDAP